jgi:hypothetical protein
VRHDEYCEGCETCCPGAFLCHRCDRIICEDDPEYNGLCEFCAAEDFASDVNVAEVETAMMEANHAS